MKPVIKDIPLPGRVRLNYCEAGDPAGTPVIALHGVTDSWRSFQPLLPYLPSSIRLLAVTQRGHGDSQKPAQGYRPADFAADVAAFMDVLKIERAIVVGHSMGSVNALRFALEFPARVLGLVLAGAQPYFGRHEDVVAFWQGEIATLADPVPHALARDFQQSTLAQPIPPDYLALVISESLKVPAHVWRSAFEGFMQDDFSAALTRITAPALIAWGRHDSFCRREDQEDLRRALPTARFIEYANAGHALHWEEPERFARDVGAFAQSLAASCI